nr:TetR/AcrR family transcriptional regulator [Aquisalimonas sp.]
MGRPRQHDEHTRAELLETAARLLTTHGPEALSMRRVARLGETSTQAIYTLFGGKDGLIRAMYRQGFETLDRYLATVAPGDDAEAELCALALAYRGSALSQRHLYTVMFACPLPEFVPTDEDQQLALGTLERLRTAVRRHQRAFGRHDVEAVTLQLWALAHGLASLELQGALGEPEQAAGYWQQAFRAAVHGYGAAAD